MITITIHQSNTNKNKIMGKYGKEEVLIIPTAIIKHKHPEFFKELNSFTRVGKSSDLKEELWNNSGFILRDNAEELPEFKQIIPYAVIIQDGKILVYTRGKLGQEVRLHAKKSIGVGGHINPKDLDNFSDSHLKIDLALLRELEEEIKITQDDIQELNFIGVVNEDMEEVGKVHLGLVYVVRLKPEAVLHFEDCLLEPEFLSIPDLDYVYGSLEGWSQLIVEAIKES